ncbi:hypothetical protein, partial [Candidatus Cyanaurora vandensis]|uniref:hypothetical protein n=1 Tax=Candidatus Cyanaurora vandensis TaxID=2714958 RepID=UPI00257BFA8B
MKTPQELPVSLRPAHWQVGVLTIALGLTGACFAYRMHLGIAWEDSYQHWLVSAYLWETGQWVSPLGGHHALLPVPHLVYALVLGGRGVYNLEALEVTAALFTLGTAVGLFRWG